MKEKCKICGLKSNYDISERISEWYASRLIHISLPKKNERFLGGKIVFICRDCINKILDVLAFEQRKISKLYEPEIKSKDKK